LPWRPPSLKLRKDKALDPYRILVSEIMLQQTQVGRVLEKYSEFVRVFPTIHAVARASFGDVLRVWSGLGYNRRALFLHRASQFVVRKYHGGLPRTVEELRKLPGVGTATASAVCAFAYNQPTVFVETNIRSVFIHHFFKKKRIVTDDEILALVVQTLDQKNPREWYYALMDYGVMLKKRYVNPSRKSVQHVRQPPFRGSHRELRGKMVKLLLARPRVSYRTAAHMLSKSPQEIREVFAQLRREGLVR
jgi:A/G-specific adenine glycosylase